MFLSSTTTLGRARASIIRNAVYYCENGAMRAIRADVDETVRVKLLGLVWLPIDGGVQSSLVEELIDMGAFR